MAGLSLALRSGLQGHGSSGARRGARSRSRPGAPASAGTLPLDAAKALDAAANQVEVLHTFLELSRRHASRVALLIARGESLGVWKALGFTEQGGSDDVTRRVALTTSAGGPLAKVMEGNPIELPADNEISRQLGSLDATRAVLVPMVVKEKISGALYADAVAAQDGVFDASALGFLTYLTGLVVDRLATRKLKPAPALRPPEVLQPRVRQTEAPLDLTPEPEMSSPAPELELLSTDSTMPPRTAAPQMPPPGRLPRRRRRRRSRRPFRPSP